VRTIEVLGKDTEHAAPITHVAFRPDGERLASCSYDGTVLIWDTSDPARPVQQTRLTHRRLVNSSAWNPAEPSLLATASADKTVAVWRVPDEGPADLVSVLARHTDDINSVAWLPDGKRLICVSEDGRATMWDALNGTFVAEVGSHEAHCMMVSVSHEGLVATVGEDGMVAVSDPDGARGTVNRKYDSSIEGCAWSRSGAMLAIARDDGAVDLLTDELAHVRTVEVSSSAARIVDWSEDDSGFVVGAYDGSLHFFDIDGERLHRTEDGRVWPRSVAACRGLVAAGSFWSTPHIFEFATARQIAEPAGPTHGPNAMAKAGSELFVGGDSGTVFAFDWSGDPEKPSARRIEMAPGPVLSLACTEDGVIYAGTYSGHVVRYDGALTTSGQLGAPVPSLCAEEDGTLIAGTYNGDIIVLDPASLEVLTRHAPHEGSVKGLAALPAGGFLSAATDRTISAGTAKDRTTLWEHGNLVNSVCQLDGSVAASAARDHTVKVGRITSEPDGTWQLEHVQTLLGPDESVKCVGLLGTSDSPVVLAGSYDFGLYVWEVDWSSGGSSLASGRVLAEFGQGLSCMQQLDADHVAVACWDGAITIVGRAPDGTVRAESSFDVGTLARSSASDSAAAA